MRAPSSSPKLGLSFAEPKDLVALFLTLSVINLAQSGVQKAFTFH